MRITALTLLLALLPGSASAATISSEVSEQDGLFIYSYSIDNSVGSFPVSALSLEFPFEQALADWNPLDIPSGGDVSVPLNDPFLAEDDWESFALTFLPGTFSQGFSALGPRGEADVQVGSQLSGFSFSSRLQPASTPFTVFGPAGESLSGTILAPSPVPEPSAALSVLISLSFLLARRTR